MTQRQLALTLLLAGISLSSTAQVNFKSALENYFINYRVSSQIIRAKAHLDSITQNDSLRTITIHASNAFGEQMFTDLSTRSIYTDIRKLLPDTLQAYQLTVKTGDGLLNN